MAVATARARRMSLWPDEGPDESPLAATFTEATEAAEAILGRAGLPAPRMSLAAFVRGGWDVLEPDTPFEPNWHIDAICLHLEAVTRCLAITRLAEGGDGIDDWWRQPTIPNLLINIPPGFMKSLLTSVFWPAWVWTVVPGWRAIFASYSEPLALRDSVRCRTLIESEWYQETFRPTWRLAGDQNVKSYFQNTATGFRLCVSVGGRATGFRGHCIVVDDPLNAKERHSDTRRATAIDWWDTAMSSRLNDKRSGARVVVMQRLHEEDLSGHLLARGGYEHLCLPMEFEPERRATTSIGWTDPRTEPAELLFPAMFPPEVLPGIKTEQGSQSYAGQYQQRPSPAEGGMFRRSWWRYWRQLTDDEGKAIPFDLVLQSWDMAFKDTDGSDYVVGQVWGRRGGEFYLLDQIRGRLDFPATARAVVELSRRWPNATTKLIEDKANGPAVIATLRTRVPGLIAVEPQGGKEARAAAVSPLVEAGNVYLPDPKLHPWVADLIDECAAFPAGAHDDQVDAMTQALLRLMLRKIPQYKSVHF